MDQRSQLVVHAVAEVCSQGKVARVCACGITASFPATVNNSPKKDQVLRRPDQRRLNEQAALVGVSRPCGHLCEGSPRCRILQEQAFASRLTVDVGC